MDAYRTDMKRALTSWGFITGIAGFAIAAFFGAFEQMLPVFQGQMAEMQQGFTMELFFGALNSDVVKMVLPLLCALPFTPAFLDDYKSRYLRSYLPRSGKREYITSKVMATLLSGGLTLLLGLFLTLTVFSVMFLPLETPPPEAELSEYEQQMQMIMGTEQPADNTAQLNFVQLMQKSLAFFLCGGLWSLVGALLAAVTMSKYMAYASPFIMYYVLVILSQRYFTDLYVINPQEWLNPAGDWVGGAWGASLLVGEILVILAFLYAYVIRKKIREM